MEHQINRTRYNKEIETFLNGGGEVTHLPESIERDNVVFTAQPKQSNYVDNTGCIILNTLIEGL